MRYIGGKSKLAVPIAKTILEHTDSRQFYFEPFVGGASVFAKLAPHFKVSIGADNSPDLIAMWDGIMDGSFVPPESVTEEEYAALKTAPPSALRGLVGFGGSFGGKFFGGYARGGYNASGEPRNHYGESARRVKKIAKDLDGSRVIFKVADYSGWDLSTNPHAVVYCDPPYAGTQGYSTGAFDSLKFWETMDAWADLGCAVFVSEYAAPDHWTSVWEQTHRQSLVMPSQGRNLTTEKLFTRV